MLSRVGRVEFECKVKVLGLALRLTVCLVRETKYGEDLVSLVGTGSTDVDLIRRGFIDDAHDSLDFRPRAALNLEKSLLDLARNQLLDEEVPLTILR